MDLYITFFWLLFLALPGYFTLGPCAHPLAEVWGWNLHRLSNPRDVERYPSVSTQHMEFGVLANKNTFSSRFGTFSVGWGVPGGVRGRGPNMWLRCALGNWIDNFRPWIWKMHSGGPAEVQKCDAVEPPMCFGPPSSSLRHVIQNRRPWTPRRIWLAFEWDTFQFLHSVFAKVIAILNFEYYISQWFVPQHQSWVMCRIVELSKSFRMRYFWVST